MEQSKFDQSELQSLVLTTVRVVQTQIRWKPGKDTSHLRTRICYGHLPVTATITDYEAIIHHTMNEPTADVWVYTWLDGSVYPTVSEKVQLAVADQILAVNATAFCDELSTITSLTYERQQRNPSPTQWWWYLDVITHLPEAVDTHNEFTLVPA